MKKIMRIIFKTDELTQIVLESSAPFVYRKEFIYITQCNILQTKCLPLHHTL